MCKCFYSVWSPHGKKKWEKKIKQCNVLETIKIMISKSSINIKMSLLLDIVACSNDIKFYKTYLAHRILRHFEHKKPSIWKDFFFFFTGALSVIPLTPALLARSSPHSLSSRHCRAQNSTIFIWLTHTPAFPRSCLPLLFSFLSSIGIPNLSSCSETHVQPDTQAFPHRLHNIWFPLPHLATGWPKRKNIKIR